MRAQRLSLVLLVAMTFATVARAEDLPVQLQIQLLSKMTSSIPNLQPPAGALKILVVHAGSGDAVPRGAQTLVNAIRQTGKFGSFDTDPKLVSVADAKALKDAIASEKPQAIYLSPEVDAAGVAKVIEASSGSGAVTISTVSDHPKLGIMLGFSLIEARPRVLVNLKQARKENIEFKNALLTYTIIVDK